LIHDEERLSLNFAGPDTCLTHPGGSFVQQFIFTMVYLTRAEHFNAAHRLYNPSWSKEKNDEVFGKCANDNWHGHNYELFVTVKGDPDPDTGFLIDAKKLSNIINQYVVDKLDHRNLNLDVDFMQGKMCSSENLVIEIWNQLQPNLPTNVRLHCIKLYETPRIYVEYSGGK
jgi:6-pyruvoyltetrahydropterin/6-carboxytetrahydropterin synthase